MSVFTKLVTFSKTTLLSVPAFLLRSFVRHPARLVSPYPLAPDLENCVVDVGHDGCDFVQKGLDLEKGIFSVSPIQDGSDFPTRSKHGQEFYHLQDSLPAASLLLVVTNLVRTSAITPQKHVQSQSRGENVHSARSQVQRKPTLLRRMPRYLKITGAAPAQATSPVKNTPSGKKARRGSLVWFLAAHKSPPIPPLKLESASLDLATGIKRVFYTAHNEGGDCHDAEYHNIRDLFNRDSVWPGLTSLDHIDAADEEDEEDGYGQPLMHALPNSQSSELPYLCDSVSSLSVSSSTSSESFNDLLASVERKWPGTEWSDNVQFSADEDNGDDNASKDEWSDVFGLDKIYTV
ncbi:hypothetical protein B0H19DRAFT_1377666 [Mycena capillaripes]|nr:hypothetical protein B0H19DRAFT_1377666 [Mycena capillaripes]